MTVYTDILGNMLTSPEWEEKLRDAEVDYIPLDQWTAQKSRFLAKGASGKEYPVALKRHTQVADGDIIEFDPAAGRAAVLRIELNPVMVVEFDGITNRTPEDLIRISLELGHAIGNQHWPAVVKGTRIYVPLTVDKKVMMSVMETHHIEGINFRFEKGFDVIPYLLPHEIRRLFGGAGHESHEHTHSHDHAHGHIVHAHEHEHDGHVHSHEHEHDSHGHHHHDHDHD